MRPPRRGTVGIVANPASGKDIRRLVAHASTFDNNEKISIVRRVLLALDSLGVERVWYMPDSYGIAPRAAQHLELGLALESLPMPVLDNSGDTLEAARRLADLAVDCLVTLGGDGTNRMAVKGIGDVPIVAISTGTNNVFPVMLEGTIAGLAAGLVATCEASRRAAIRRAPRLDLFLDGDQRDMALIDVVTSRLGWIGARALWDPEQLREIVVSRVDPARIGMCAIAGLLHPEEAGRERGVHVRIGTGGNRLQAPIAPGLVKTVPIAASTLIEPGSRVELDASPCVVALDGEREFEILGAANRLEVELNPNGPSVVDVAAAITAGALAGALAAGYS